MVETFFKKKKTYSEDPGSSVYNHFHVQLFIHIYLFNFEPFRFFWKLYIDHKNLRIQLRSESFLIKVKPDTQKNISPQFKNKGTICTLTYMYIIMWYVSSDNSVGLTILLSCLRLGTSSQLPVYLDHYPYSVTIVTTHMTCNVNLSNITSNVFVNKSMCNWLLGNL